MMSGVRSRNPTVATRSAKLEDTMLGTTLQVRAGQWPADRAAFERYWAAALEQVSIDDIVREYLHAVATLEYLPRVLAAPLAGFARFVTTGFLPPRFRAEMRLPWSDQRQRWFDRSMGVLGVVTRHSPRAVREFPCNACLWGLRRRIASGRPLV
jgi:uncharacterized protein (DUF2236 family)